MRKYVLGLVLWLIALPAFAQIQATSIGVGVSALTNTSQQCALVSPSIDVTLQGFSFGNLSTTAAIITFFDTNSVSATSTAARSFPFVIPGASSSNQGGGSNVFPNQPIAFLVGMAYCLTLAPASSAFTTGQVQGTILYK